MHCGRALVLTSVVLLTVVAAARAEDAPVRPDGLPSWVVPVAVPSPTGAAERDTEMLLVDQQEQVEAQGRVRFEHVAYAVGTAEGVQSSSELSVWRTAGDVLTWHFVRLHRAGTTRDLLPKLAIEVTQPEEQLRAGVLDGSRREHARLEDVRVGDVIEYAFSVLSRDAARLDRYAALYWLGRSVPVRRVHVLVSWPPDRELFVGSVHAQVERTAPNALRYRRDDVPAYALASREPARFDPTPRLWLSEFTAWSDVVAWALPHYRAQPAPELQSFAEALRSKGSSQEAALAAIRFVQDEIRYLGLEQGERALIPQPPQQVFARRFGDCKDKALLLVTLLRQLGLEADPVLVHKHWRRGITAIPPSTRAFDHVVVRAQLSGRELWVDPTRSLQRGPLESLDGLPFGWGLVVREGERALRALPMRTPREPDLVVHERFSIKPSNSAYLRVVTTYLGEQADAMRASLAGPSRGEMQKRYLDSHDARYGELSVHSPLEVEDDPARNRIVVREEYKIAQFWSDGERVVEAWSLSKYLPEPEASRGARAFSVPYPVYVRHVLELNEARGPSAHEERERIEGAAFRYDFRSHREGETEILEHELRTKLGEVAGRELAEYRKLAERTRGRLGSSYAVDPISQPGIKIALSSALLLVLLLGVGFTRMLRLSGRHPSRSPPKRPPLARGEAPQSAIPVREVVEAHAELRRVRCCSEALFGEELPAPQELRYDGKPLLLYRRSCATCGRPYTRYFALDA